MTRDTVAYFVSLAHPDRSEMEQHLLTSDILEIIQEEGIESPVQANDLLLRRISPAPLDSYLACLASAAA
jgi:hypothetical protein